MNSKWNRNLIHIFKERSRITIIAIFITLLLYGSDICSGTLQGNVIDSESKLPIAYCNVLLDGTKIGGMTLKDGTYRITGIPSGIYTVKATLLGAWEGKETIQIEDTTILYLDLQIDYSGQGKILDLTDKYSSLCRLHNTQMNIAKVFIGHHLQLLEGEDQMEYLKAENNLFPNAKVWYCLDKRDDDVFTMELGYRYAKIYQCPDCITARNEWLDENEHLRDRLPF